MNRASPHQRRRDNRRKGLSIGSCDCPRRASKELIKRDRSATFRTRGLGRSSEAVLAVRAMVIASLQNGDHAIGRAKAGCLMKRGELSEARVDGMRRLKASGGQEDRAAASLHQRNRGRKAEDVCNHGPCVLGTPSRAFMGERVSGCGEHVFAKRLLCCGRLGMRSGLSCSCLWRNCTSVPQRGPHTQTAAQWKRDKKDRGRFDGLGPMHLGQQQERPKEATGRADRNGVRYSAGCSCCLVERRVLIVKLKIESNEISDRQLIMHRDDDGRGSKDCRVRIRHSGSVMNVTASALRDPLPCSRPFGLEHVTRFRHHQTTRPHRARHG